MLAVQKYSIVKSFEKNGIDPSILIFQELPRHRVILHNLLSKLPTSLKWENSRMSNIYLKEYSYFFRIETRKPSYFGSYKVELIFSPGVEKMVSHKVLEFDGRDKKFSWREVYEYIELWSKLTSNEILSLNYIDRVIYGIQELNETNSIVDGNFSSDEKSVIIDKINMLKRGVETELDLTDYKLDLVLNKLEALKVKLDSQNKFDFKSSLYGLMINLTSSVIYDKSGMFLNLFKSIFTNTLLK